MQVKLLTSKSSLNEQIHNAVLAMLTCTSNEANMEQEGFDPIDKLKKIIGLGHESVIKHINLTFRVEDISRALLQELARHRHISLSVQSTRRTLKKTILNPNPKIRKQALGDLMNTFLRQVEKMQLAISSDDAANNFLRHLCYLIDVCAEEEEIVDTVKYFLPELMPTTLVMTCNLRELRHIFELRTAPAALWEFRALCVAIRETLPDDIRELTDAE